MVLTGGHGDLNELAPDVAVHAVGTQITAVIRKQGEDHDSHHHISNLLPGISWYAATR